MKEAIEQVIAELEEHIHKSDQNAKAAADEGLLYREGIHEGRGTAFSVAVMKLKAVLANGENDSSGIPGNDGQAQEQIQSETDNG